MVRPLRGWLWRYVPGLGSIVGCEMLRTRRVGFLLVAVLAAALVPGPAVAADPAATVFDAAGVEPGVSLDASARASGAIGAYYDAASASYVVVYPAGAQPAVAASLQSNLEIRSREASATIAEIDSIAADLVAVAGSLGKGQAFGFYYDMPRDVTVISSSAPRSLFDAVLARYPGRIALEQVAASSRLSRDADPAPHRGGSSIVNAQQTRLCSSGFSVHRAADGKDYMLTAGHCFSNGQAVFGADGVAWGTVQWRAQFPAKDMEMIGGKTYRGQIYGGNGTGTARNVVGAGDGTIGSTYCQSGTVSTETCNHVLQSNSATYCDDTDPPLCTTGMATYTNGGTGGDSGGPYYLKYANGTVSARGIIIAVSGSYGYAHKWSTLASTFGVTIVTN